MVTLHHAIKIAAPRSAVYRALTDLDEMNAWHMGGVQGTIAPGEVMTLTPNPHLRFSWRTETLEPDTKVVQTEVEGPGSSVGKTLTFLLSDLDDGRTQVDLTDGEWPDGDPHLPFCNTRWGQVLDHLKSYVEKT
ncbi:SRPBCC family protein [Paraburkholderia tropica]|uniref:SRPBCC family protein n=1 Tax=Paraburkholderia tropica TaxID=92647 RepID=UPI002AB5F5D7|nr:SRPBCC domain-containing protein [Paraburkholderia tropica]